MYSYYGLAALGPSIQKYLWWKKYITILQLWQFVLYGIYGLCIFLFQRNYPIYWMYFGLTQPPLFFYLFYDFYHTAYVQKKKRYQKKEQQQIENKSDPTASIQSQNGNSATVAVDEKKID